VPFNWDATADVSNLRVGHLSGAADNALDGETRRNTENALRVIRSLGVAVVPFALPDVPIEAIDFIRYAETSAAFADVTRAGVLTDVERGPEQSRRPDEIRAGHFIPAVEFIQANRYRMRLMEEVDRALGDLDLFIGSNQAITNRTGHPVLSIPNGFSHGSPTALHLTGKLFGEQDLLLLAHAFQKKTDFHAQHPRL
jgi:Asp-tRNA(Asn)/Glu-tRNA(Gln) amidotransferase A subunit family amidase